MFLNATDESLVVDLTTAPNSVAPVAVAATIGDGKLANSYVSLAAEASYTLVAAPASGSAIEIRSFSVQNKDDATHVVTVSLKKDTTKYALCILTMGVGDTLIYAGGAFSVLDANGRLKSSYSAALSLADGENLALGTSTGSKIGTAVGQKLGLWNKTPIVQPAHADQAALVATASIDGADTVDKAAVLAALNALETLVLAMRTAMVDFGSMKGAA